MYKFKQSLGRFTMMMLVLASLKSVYSLSLEYNFNGEYSQLMFIGVIVIISNYLGGTLLAVIRTGDGVND
ncbi:hypothetical protein ACQRKX_000452 [Enterobacter cloacae]